MVPKEIIIGKWQLNYPCIYFLNDVLIVVSINDNIWKFNETQEGGTELNFKIKSFFEHPNKN